MTFASFIFTNRVVDACNSLPNWVVMTNSTNTFKRRLDIYWQDQEIIYDFRAQLQATGSGIVIYLDMAKMTILVMLKCEMRWT